ncbi:MAG: Lrp/AsnC family transcriptional regulator [Candidatus Woesearchaeota archaeon]
MKDNTLQLLSHFRRNARETLTKISRKTSIPVSTIFDRLKDFEKSIIKKHTSLIDFNKLGYVTRANITLKFDKTDRLKAAEYLQTHMNVNSLYKITNGFDYMAEVVFKNLFELEQFREDLEERFNLHKIDMHFIIDDIKREEFMADESMISMIEPKD